MATYTLKGHITEDGRLEVAVPEGIRPGDAEVVLTVPATDEVQPRRGSGAAILAALRKIEEMPDRPRRTKEEIDADLNEMRDEWDND